MELLQDVGIVDQPGHSAVTKLCSPCRRYFSSPLDGNYLCPECALFVAECPPQTTTDSGEQPAEEDAGAGAERECAAAAGAWH